MASVNDTELALVAEAVAARIAQLPPEEGAALRAAWTSTRGVVRERRPPSREMLAPGHLSRVVRALEPETASELDDDLPTKRQKVPRSRPPP